MSGITRFAAASNWDLEQSYEQRPRSLKRKKKDKKESTRLPIKTAHGIVQQVEAPPSPEETEDETEDVEPGKEPRQNGGEWKGFAEEEVKEEKPRIPERQRVLEAKEELARLASALNEDPEENVGMLKQLRELAQDHNPTIQKLALATQLAVYRDVIPGYRIRPLTEEEQKIKVSKDVKQLRNFEQSLVANYQAYVEMLAGLSRAGRTDPNPAVVAVAKIAVNCACGLLQAVPHFNFRGELLKILVERVSVKTVDESFVKCREALEELFRNDEDGNVSFDAVKLLTKMIKGKKYRIHESVLNTFLSLRLLSELDVKASRDQVENPHKRKKEKEFYTKKKRKLVKEQKAIEKEMKEADATVSHEERDKLQSETLKLVFVTYFHILKERPPGLMGATLEGLAKYAHLINADFFGDLLEALKELISAAEEEAEEDDDIMTSRNSTREALLCVITAFALLQGQGESMMSVDLSFFTTHLYTNLLPLSLDADIEHSHKSLRLPDPNAADQPAPSRVNVATEIEMLIRALDSLFFQQNMATHPPSRIAAFIKRLLISSLNMPEKSTLACVGTVNRLAKKHQRKVAGLFSTEDTVGDGVYAMEAEEPERSNPFAATVWETLLLEKHYSPKVAEAAKTLGKGFVTR